jgi:allantoinase
MFRGIIDSMAQGEALSAGAFETHASVALRSTRVVTPEGVRAAILSIENGKIAAVFNWNEPPANVLLRDFGDLVLLPGLVDTHIHINEPGRTEWEGFATATQAAASGGVTTLVDMPLNCIPETINIQALEAKRRAALGNVWVDWMAWGGVVGHDGVAGNEADMAALIEAGVPGFKCFQVHSGIEGFAWVDEAQIRKALGVLTGTGLPLLAHAEVGGPVEEATAGLKSQSPTADWRRYATYLASRPDEAELEAIALLIRLAEEFQSSIHIVHLASAKALPMIRAARDRGLPLTVETCPHYLWFSAEEIPDAATQFKCAPPLRTAANREELWQALLDGTIDFVATDHSPCPPVMKCIGTDPDTGRFDQAWGGIASIGLALPVVWTGVISRSADLGNLELLAEWLATRPAQLAGLASRKGALAPGFDADVVVFDPDAKWTVAQADLHFRHKLSPYDGVNLQGQVIETFLRGQSIYRRHPQPAHFSDHFSAEALGQELRRGQ